MAASLTELQTNLKDYIEQRLSVQTMLLMNATIKGKIAKLQVFENFCMMKNHTGANTGEIQIHAQALRAEIEALEGFRNSTI